MYENRLNLTIGAFNFEFSEMFDHEDGEVVPKLSSLRELLESIGSFGNFNILLKTSEEHKLGESSENGYQTGVLGMLQRKEIDICFLPVPLDIPDAPGFFSPVIHDEAYHIYSFPESSLTVTQNIAKSLESIKLSVWIMIAAITLILEGLIHFSSISGLSSKRKMKENFILETIKLTLANFWSTVFGQYIPDRSILRLTQVISIMFLTMILNASFSTTTIAGDEEKKIDSLRDVVEQDKKPFFIEGESVAELFQKGVNKDYADVYRLAQRKGTAVPVPISSLDFFNNMDTKLVYFCSNEIARAIGKISEVIGIDITKNEHRSTKAYHRASTAMLMNPAHNAYAIERRIHALTIRQIQGSLFITDLRRIINELLISASLGISASQMAAPISSLEHNVRFFSPLKFQGIRFVFIIWASLIVTSIFVFFIEILIGKGVKNMNIYDRSI